MRIKFLGNAIVARRFGKSKDLFQPNFNSVLTQSQTKAIMTLIKKRTTWVLLLLSISSAVIVANAETLSPEEAQKKAQSVLNQIEPKKVAVGNDRQQAIVPNLDGYNPVIDDYTRAKNPTITDNSTYNDPFAVAERYRSSVSAKKATEQADVPKTDLMIFVSFSMPEASLRRLANEASKVGAVIVLNGFKDGNLKGALTANKILAERGATVLIHPDFFTRFDVKNVPQIVLTNPISAEAQDSCTNDQCEGYLKVAGDVSLRYGLEALVSMAQAQNNAPLGKIAQHRLDQF